MNVYVSQAKEKQKDGGVLETMAVFTTPTNLIHYWVGRFGLDATNDEQFRYARTLSEEEFIMLRGGPDRNVELVANRIKCDAWYEREVR